MEIVTGAAGKAGTNGSTSDSHDTERRRNTAHGSYISQGLSSLKREANVTSGPARPAARRRAVYNNRAESRERVSITQHSNLSTTIISIIITRPTRLSRSYFSTLGLRTVT
ncbi:hypothetical protein EVAR_54056_1 [Eumeta japonica]|uniref:Uncharacterized protein n=1 Tax=Eumeta variegata TaxID=151549 RepID=A0A4C1XDP6_EUMVA|nr:hypothetical protein EVAR_54056_1 [Eumeta japonica]